MKFSFKQIIPLTLLASTGLMLADSCNSNCNACDTPAKTVTCYTPRSQSFNNMIKNAGMDPDNQFLYDADFNASFKINFEYDQTFNDKTLTQCLFGPAAISINTTGSNNCNDDLVIRVVGTEATTPPNGMTDLVADNFFLPKNFSSTITFKPSIRNYNIHFQAYFGFDNWCPGLYARIYGPVSVSQWKLDACEVINSPKASDPLGDYAAGEIAPVAVPIADLYSSFLSYTQGSALQLPGATVDGGQPVDLAGPTVQALKYTRFGANCEDNTRTQFADLRAELGWNFLLDEDYHLGIYIAAAAPTAGDCEDDCNTLLWGAKAGNGKHWELGGGITAHYTFCRSEDNREQWDFFIDATINHMFKHTEQRTFDLKGKPLSRYLIAEQLTTPVTNNLTYGAQVGGTLATYQFAGVYAPVANFTTQNVSVSFPVQADVMAKFVYTKCGFSWAIGYDFWGQACPDVELACNDDCNATTFTANTWALRGDAHVYGFGNSDGVNFDIQPIPATYNATTAFNIGTAFESTTGTNPADANCGVDSPSTPATVNAPTPATLFVAPSGTGSDVDICVSNPPTFIQASDIDICSITRGMSNSIFTEFNYTWVDRDCWIPYVGIGARLEFGNNTDDCTNPNLASSVVPNNSVNCCDNCGSCSVTKWGVWVQGGVSFD